MGTAFSFSSAAFIATLVTAYAEESIDFLPLQGSEKIGDALQLLSPANIVNKVSAHLQSANGTKCLNQVKLLQKGLKKGSIWAWKMIDASSEIPSGIFTGNRKDLGMYDECIAINTIEDGEEIGGHHCMYGVQVRMVQFKLNETLSVCMPSTCGPDHIQELLEYALKMAPIDGINVTITGIACSALDPLKWTAGGVVTLVGFCTLLLFLIGCTICDIFLMYSNKKYESNHRIVALCQFSFYTNARRLLNTKTTPETLPALQGLRFFSMCWVILGHAYFLHLFAPTINLTDLREWTSSWHSIYLKMATFSVDTFFTISGFLMSYLFLKEMSTGRSFNIFAYYIHRYLRLTPAYAALLLISIFILPRMGSGPLWQIMMTADVERCRKSWWSMLLYIHNYHNEGCMTHTWSLATEMQFFWLSPIVLYPLAKKPKIGLIILAACFIASIATPATIIYQTGYTSAMFENSDLERNMKTLETFYQGTHVRAAPLLIGIFSGYLVFTQKEESRRVTKWIGWLLTVAIFAFCFFSRRKFQQKDYTYERTWETFYIPVARPSWSAAVAWIIYACVRGFGGPITTFLSFPIYHPLSRLSYCMYLLHYVIQWSKLKAMRVPRFFSDFEAFDNFLGDLMLSLVLAFVLSLVFESPVLVLEKMVKQRNRRKISQSKKELSDEKMEKGINNPGLNLQQ